MDRIINMLLINVVISVAFFVYCKMKKSEESLMRLILTLLFPLVGVTIFLIIDNFVDKSKDRTGELQESSTYEADIDSFFLKRLNVEREVNIVPVKEALLVNNNEIKRRLIVDSLKEDVYEYRNFLKEALKDKDTETSHYAAAAVVEIKRKLLISVQETAGKYEKEPQNLNKIRDYAIAIERIIESELLDKKNTYKYLHIYSSVLQKMIRMNHKNKEILGKKIACDIRLKDYDKAMIYCNLLKKLDKNSLKPYMMLLKIYYEIGNTSKFNETLEFIKSSRIKIQRKALGSIRFWLGGVRNV